MIRRVSRYSLASSACLSTIKARSFDNQRALRMKKRRDRSRKRGGDLPGRRRVYLGWSSTKSDGLRRPDVGLHRICLHRNPRPTTRQHEDTDVHSRTQTDRPAGLPRNGCLPRIRLLQVVYLQQPNGTTRSALSEALEDGLTIVLNRSSLVTAGNGFAQLRLIPIQ